MWHILDFAIPMDYHVTEKEEEKIDKFIDLAGEVRRQFRVKTLIVPIVLGALGDSPSKTIRIAQKIGNRKRDCCIIIGYNYT